MPLVSSSKILKHHETVIQRNLVSLYILSLSILKLRFLFSAIFPPQLQPFSKKKKENAVAVTSLSPYLLGLPQDGLKHPWIVTAAAPDPETGREKTIEVEEEMREMGAEVGKSMG